MTGHRSKVLHLYERPTEQQRKEVSSILMNGSGFNKENSPGSSNTSQSASLAVKQSVHSGASMCSSIFSGFSNCIVSISPQSFTVNVSPAPTTSIHHLLDGIDLKDLL